MTDRAETLLNGRRERLEEILGHPLSTPERGASDMPPETRRFLRDEAEDLYWNELEWENITDEEQVENGALTEMAFPGFLAFVRGLLLTEVMPDALAPASPRPEAVEDILRFLADRVVELEESLARVEQRLEAELAMTSRLIDLVLYLMHGLDGDEVERVEGGMAREA